MPELSLAIPFYNESANLNEFLDQLCAVFDKNEVDYEILAVNNGSTDNTGELLQKRADKHKRIRVVTVAVNEGYGWGIIQGLRKAQGKFVGYCWGDNQIVAEDIYKVYKTLASEKVDICKVYRVQREDSSMRKVESFLYNTLFRIWFGLKLKDINGCPKIMTRAVLAQLHPTSKDWFIDAELMIKAKRKQFKIKEIPVTYHKREAGKSHVRLTTGLEFVRNGLKFTFKR